MLNQLKNLPFNFSSLVVIDPMGGSQNPLGLISAQTKISRKIFPQFTVLTNNPRYHSLLCGIIATLNSNHQKIDPREIRKAEVLWGLAQAMNNSDGSSPSPINIRRYKALFESVADLKRIDISIVSQAKFGLLEKLGYGVWGHYSRPSQAWLILDPESKSLSTDGAALGQEFNQNTGFRDLLESWFKGKSIPLNNSLKECGSLSSLDPNTVSRAERKAWKNIFDQFLRRANKTRESQINEIWESLPGQEKLSKWLTETSYSNFFNRIESETSISRDSRLSTILKMQNHFEKAAAWIELTFEVQYLLAERGYNIKPLDWNLIIAETRNEIQMYNKVRGDFGIEPLMFKRLEKTVSPNDFLSTILATHKEVQKHKGKGAYLDADGNLLQSGALNCDRALKVLDEIEKDQKINPNFVTFLYRRDWHYQRAAYYKEFCT